MNYDRMREIVARRLDASGLGALLVWEEVVGGTGPMDPGVVTEVTHAVRVALLDFTLAEKAQAASIEEGDKKAVIAASAVAPDTSMKLRIGARDWAIHHVSTSGPDGVAIMHEARVR